MFIYHNFEHALTKTTTREQIVANWYRQIMKLDTTSDAPPLARAFSYIKQVPGEWIAIQGDKAYPFHAMRRAANPAFTLSTLRSEDWKVNMSYLLTWADIDEKAQAIDRIKTLFAALRANNMAVGFEQGLIYIMMDYLLPRPQRAQQRSPEGTNYHTAVWLSEDPAKQATSPNREACPTRRAAKLETTQYTWLVRYYHCNNPGTGPIYSYAPPLEAADRTAIYEEITKTLSFPDLPSIASAPTPINETKVATWNTSEPQCHHCPHNTNTCDGRNTYKQQQRQRGRNRNPGRTRRPPGFTLGNHAIAYVNNTRRNNKH